MHVIATAGHVDHGKSTLVKALTGMEPDRWEEERRRGLTIGLGFAWTEIDGEQFAFVDVPGHERFVSTMLSGVGPVPAVLFVVAADGGWMPQSAEHLAILDALQVRHGVLVVTRADLADPGPARDQALARIARTSLGHVPSVAVSPGHGIDELKARLAALALPEPDTRADVRLWVDRGFTIDGAGTVVTGTLAAGTISTGDELVLGSRTVHVKGVHSLGRKVRSTSAVARVAVNLRGVERSAVHRGDTLRTPDAWRTTTSVDVRVNTEKLGKNLVVHIGSAAVGAHLRPLGDNTARLQLTSPLPLRIGDRLVLRAPDRHDIAAGADVLDIAPPPFLRRGDPRRRATALAAVTDLTAFHLGQSGFLRPRDVRRLGLAEPAVPLTAGWYVAADRTGQVRSEVDSWRREHPLRPGIPLETLRQRTGLPDIALVAAFAAKAGLEVHDGHVGTGGGLPEPVARALKQVAAGLEHDPFQAPDADRLKHLGLGPRELAAAVRGGALVKVADGIVLLPGAFELAASRLAGIGPFTPATAKQALGTTRRVVVPLLERLDELGLTRRHDDGTRTICEPGDQRVR